MSRGEYLGELEAMVLAALIQVPGEGTPGVDVYREVLARTGRDPTVAGVHVTLRRLERKGLVSSSVGEPSARGGRPQRFYCVTRRGNESLATFREMWESLLGGLEPSSGDV